MKELDKNCVYSLEDLTSEQWELLKPVLNKNSVRKFKYDTLEGNFRDGFKYIFFNTTSNWVFIHNDDIKNYSNIVNAKELFYTLANVQVDCRELTQEEVNNIIDIYKLNDIKFSKRDFKGTNTSYSLIMSFNNIPNEYNTITYKKFMELFAEPQHEVTEKPKHYSKGIDTFNPQPHYNNENGSLYKIANDLGLNHWEFDVFKRLVRCRKKNQFKEDLQKIKDTIDIYLNEYSE